MPRSPARLKPLLLKVAPDLAADDEADIAEVALALGIDGLIVSNTTVARPDVVTGRARDQAGGLSGTPLFLRATEQLARFYRLTMGRLPLIGVGGITSGADAYAKIRAGAAALQLYTALVYQGPAVVGRVLGELDRRLAEDGYARLSDGDRRGCARLTGLSGSAPARSGRVRSAPLTGRRRRRGSGRGAPSGSRRSASSAVSSDRSSLNLRPVNAASSQGRGKFSIAILDSSVVSTCSRVPAQGRQPLMYAKRDRRTKIPSRLRDRLAGIARLHGFRLTTGAPPR